MGYADEILAILNFLETSLNVLPFNTVIRGWKADAEDVKNMPTAFIVCRNDPLSEQYGANAEHRRLGVDLYTLNNVSHDMAIALAGNIVDKLGKDMSLGGTVSWTKLMNVEFYVNIMRGYNLHWSRVIYELERRRLR